MIETIVYHADCPDGFCAAYIALTRVAPDATLVPATYGKPIDEDLVLGRHVLVVDFSWPRDEMVRLHSLAKSLVVLDHHKTAEAALDGLAFCTFDMNRSGAQLAWDWARPKEQRPWYVDYVADRDLWRWSLPDSKAISAFLMTLPHDIAVWRALDVMTVEDAVGLGTGARAQVDHYVRAVCAQARFGSWKGRDLHIVNAAYPNISDVANKLCEQGAEIGVGWFVRADGMMQFSLRSIGDLDVSDLAKEQGGGGHRNAAGFQLSMQAGLQLLESWGF